MTDETSGVARTHWRRAALGVAAIALIAIVAILLALVIVNKPTGGADSAEDAAKGALRALSANDRDALISVARPDVSGREPAVDQLLSKCGGVDFSDARIATRHGYGRDVAWADVTTSGVKRVCAKFTLTMSEMKSRWYVALGEGKSTPQPAETSR
jgi:hypothetical protein